METTLKRNYSIDVLRVFAALAVVIVHSGFDQKDYFRSLIRFAVPCFFLISGYFLYAENYEKQKQRIKNSLKSITWIIIWSSLIFSIRKCPYINLNDIIGTLSWWKQNLLTLLIYNENFTASHLWYLSAYFNVLILLYVYIYRERGRDFFGLKTLILVAILLICNLILGEFNKYLLKLDIKLYHYRNFLFMGLPFVLIGILIKKYEQKILSLKFVNFRNMAICSVIISILTYLEYRQTKIIVDLYFFNIPQTIFYFLTFLLFKMENDNILSKIGREDSLYIYIFHPLAINVYLPPVLTGIFIHYASFFYFFVTVLAIRTFRFLHKKLSKR